MNRDFDSYILDIVKLVGSRGTCDRGRSGCVIVKDKNIIATGYVGAPVGMPHCDEVGHEMEEDHCVRTTHAEQNAFINAAKRGIAVDGADIYCTMFPCYTCAKLIVNSGIKRIIANNDYHASDKSKALFDVLGIKYIIVNRTTLYETKEFKRITFK